MKTVLVSVVLLLSAPSAFADRPDILKALNAWNMDYEYGNKLPASEASVDYIAQIGRFFGTGTYVGYTSSRSKICRVEIQEEASSFQATIFGGPTMRTLMSLTVDGNNPITNALLGETALALRNDNTARDGSMVDRTTLIGLIEGNLEIVIENQHCQGLVKQ